MPVFGLRHYISWETLSTLYLENRLKKDPDILLDIWEQCLDVMIMSPISKKLRGHIYLDLSVRPSVCL